MFGPGEGIDENFGGESQASYIAGQTGGQVFYDVGSGGPSIDEAIVGAVVPGVETLTNISFNLMDSSGNFVVDPIGQTLTGLWTNASSPVTGSFSFSVGEPGSASGADFHMGLLGNGSLLDTLHLSFAPEDGTIPEPSTFIIWSLLGAACIAFNSWRRRK